jgi:hypothetical protein
MKDFNVTIKLFLGGVLVFSVIDIIIAIYHLHSITPR